MLRSQGERWFLPLLSERVVSGQFFEVGGHLTDIVEGWRHRGYLSVHRYPLPGLKSAPSTTALTSTTRPPPRDAIMRFCINVGIALLEFLASLAGP